MPINVEILSQGEELLTGQTLDTNSAWMSEQLVDIGFTVKRHIAVGDNLMDLVAVLQEIAQRADCCLCTGGLGPTVDDLTAEAVSIAFDLPLEFDTAAFEQINAFFARRQRVMPESNRKQALLPQGAVRIDNAWGTAPGFALRYRNCWFAFMPGVPYEMRMQFAATVKPWLQANYELQPSKAIAIKTLGIGESAIQEKLKSIVLPAGVQFGFCAGEDDVKTKLLFPSTFPLPTLKALVAQFARELGDFVYTIDGLEPSSNDLVDVLAGLLSEAGKSVAVIETISQG